MSPPRRATIISPQFQPSSISKVVPRKTSTSTSASIDDDDDNDDDDDDDVGARSDSYSGSGSDGAVPKKKVGVRYREWPIVFFCVYLPVIIPDLLLSSCALYKTYIEVSNISIDIRKIKYR